MQPGVPRVGAGMQDAGNAMSHLIIISLLLIGAVLVAPFLRNKILKPRQKFHTSREECKQAQVIIYDEIVFNYHEVLRHQARLAEMRKRNVGRIAYRKADARSSPALYGLTAGHNRLKEEEYRFLRVAEELISINYTDNRCNQDKDEVAVSIFSVPIITCGITYLLQVHLHLIEEALRVAKEATQLDSKANRLSSSILTTGIKFGSVVQVFVESDALVFNEPFKECTWNGRHASIHFPFAAKQGQQSARVIVHVGLDGIEIGLLNFEIPIKIQDAVNDQQTAGLLSYPMAKDDSKPHLIEARPVRYKLAFISYSRKDFKEASLFAQGLEENDIKVCVDVTTLEPGDEWAKELPANISKVDAFYLMWSQNAAQSKAVELEAKEAVDRYDSTSPHRPTIKPIVISRPVPTPPEYLKKFHFDSKWLAHRTAQGRPIFQDEAQ